jgi:hypothetical protein
MECFTVSRFGVFNVRSFVFNVRLSSVDFTLAKNAAWPLCGKVVPCRVNLVNQGEPVRPEADVEGLHARIA